MSNQSKLAALASTGVTKAELNNIDGGTARGTTAVADGDGFLTNDGGTMRMTKVDTLATYMGTKITGGSMVFIASSGAISNAATVDFTQFDSTKYDSYQFRFIDILPVTDDVELRAITSSDTSSHSYDTGSADYIRQGNSTATAAFGQLASNFGIGNGTQERSNLVVDVLNPHTTNYTRVVTGGMLSRSQGYPAGLGAAVDVFTRAEAAQVNAIRFFLESGNISAGEIVMYGIANGT